MLAKRRPVIVGLGGTTRPNSSSELALRTALGFAEEAGASTLFFGGHDLQLPIYDPYVKDRAENAARLIEALRSSDGVMIASPGYHGSVSGMVKNALDYTEDMSGDARPYFDGRAVGCIACALGNPSIGATLMAMRSIVHALRGWPTPLGVGINTAMASGVEAESQKQQAERQLRILARQVVNFANANCLVD